MNTKNLFSILVIILCSTSLEAIRLSTIPDPVFIQVEPTSCPANFLHPDGKTCEFLNCQAPTWLQMGDKCTTPEPCPVEGEKRTKYNTCVTCSKNDEYFNTKHDCITCTFNKVVNAQKTGCTKCNKNQTANHETGTCDEKK